MQTGEIICSEISSFHVPSIAVRGITWSEIHSVSLKKPLKTWWHVRLRLMGCRRDSYWSSCSFYSSCQ